MTGISADSGCPQSYLNPSHAVAILFLSGGESFVRRACAEGAERARGVKVASRGLCLMSRVPSLSSPFLLGFDEIERALDRVVKGADGYPPYNIERFERTNGHPERLRIT